MHVALDGRAHVVPPELLAVRGTTLLYGRRGAMKGHTMSTISAPLAHVFHRPWLPSSRRVRRRLYDDTACILQSNSANAARAIDTVDAVGTVATIAAVPTIRTV